METTDLAHAVLRIASEVASPDQALAEITRLCRAEIAPAPKQRSAVEQLQMAMSILRSYGLRATEMSALVMLVLAQLDPSTPWCMAERKSLRIHDLIVEMRSRYGVSYAENTRETIRNKTLKPMIEAGLVLHNPDDPAISPQSAKNHYALSDEALAVIQQRQTERAL